MTLPPLDKLAFYVGLTGAAVLGVIEWPIVLDRRTQIGAENSLFKAQVALRPFWV